VDASFTDRSAIYPPTCVVLHVGNIVLTNSNLSLISFLLVRVSQSCNLPQILISQTMRVSELITFYGIHPNCVNFSPSEVFISIC